MVRLNGPFSILLAIYLNPSLESSRNSMKSYSMKSYEMDGIMPLLVFLVCLGMTAGPASAATPDLTQFSIEDLMQVKVVSATKMEQALQDTAAAVFVISAEDIRRSGVTNVMEALRLAPGVEVARIDSSRWAISIRGFNGRFASKLLVLIDGRSIYNTQFSGVYWELQDLFLPDIERIEVIRGPGGSLWGANAVNGVINIITKNAMDTEGGLATLTVGDEDRTIAGIRHGGKLGDNAHYRVYGQFSERDGLVTLDGRDASDDWRMGSGGFRLDWTPSAKDAITAQGNLYDGNLDQNYVLPSLFPPYSSRQLSKTDASGGGLQALWEHRISDTSRTLLQVYYQSDDRSDDLYIVDASTLDLDFQHDFALTGRQQIVWGLGYRRSWDHFTDTEFASVDLKKKIDELYSAFIQDQVELIPERLRLTGGVKVEHNDFTGWEWQPSVRMLWMPHPDHRLWAAVSRAVRTPSRGENGARVNAFVLPPSPLTGNLPTLFTIFGGGDLEAERLIAYEIGYRALLKKDFSLDAAVFYNDYDNIITTIPGTPFLDVYAFPPHLVVPLQLQNLGAGSIYGFELFTDWRPTESWRLRLTYSYLNSDLKNKDNDGPIYERGRNQQLSLFSSWNPRDDLDVDLWGRYVVTGESKLFSTSEDVIKVDPYVSLSLRLGWRPREDLELSLVGNNLFSNAHLEFIQEAFGLPIKVERSIYGQMKWSF